MGSYSLLAGLFDETGAMTLSEEIFVDEQPSYCAFTRETTRRNGAEKSLSLGKRESASISALATRRQFSAECSTRLVGARVMPALLSLAQHAVEPFEQNVPCPARSGIHIMCVSRHADWLPAAWTRLNHAGLVIGTAFSRVFIAHMNFKPRQPIFIAREAMAQLRLDTLRNVLCAHHRAIGIELDLHGTGPPLIRFSLLTQDGKKPSKFQRNYMYRA